LSLDKYPEDPNVTKFIETSNIWFFVYYFLEVVFKLIPMGWTLFTYDRYNVFDLIVVIVSFIDIVINLSAGDSGSNGVSMAFRGLRLIRVFRLAKSWHTFHDLIYTIGLSIKNLSSILLLMVLFIFIYSLLGMELFSYQVKFDSENRFDQVNGDYPQSTYNTFKESCISVFIILANDGWSTIFFNHYRASGVFKSLIFFISFIIIGQYMLLNLLLAILLKDFDDERDSGDMTTDS
jgi:hypothetical protein